MPDVNGGKIFRAQVFGKWKVIYQRDGELGGVFDAADETLAEILDGLIGQFADANAKFVSDYNNARIIVDTSASHASPNQPTPAPTPATPTGLTTKP